MNTQEPMHEETRKLAYATVFLSVIVFVLFALG